MLVSIIIPTYNRPDALTRTLLALTRQTMPAQSFEVIVVDNGSATPVRLPPGFEEACACTLVRVETNKERCGARNMGAEIARANVLVFLDDDLEVNAGFVEAHHRAHGEWPGGLVAGATLLPQGRLSNPFVRYRQRMEATGMPDQQGPTALLSTVAAGNMSVGRDRYFELGGFNPDLAGIEDVDFTRRHIDAGGQLVYLPEALAIHWDQALDIRSYYRRTRFAAQCSVRLARHHPALASCREQARVNGPIRRGQDTSTEIVKKTLKYVLGCPPFINGLFYWTNVLERCTSGGRFLDYHYSLLIGIAWLHGYRQGLARAQNEIPGPTSRECPEPNPGVTP